MKLIGLCILLITQVCLGQPITQEENELNKNNPFVDSLLLDLLHKTKLPGLSIAVNQNGNIIYAKGFGYADVAQKVKMQATTQIRTASVAKVITATALAKLATEGKLDFDAPIKNYIPYLKAPFSELTCRQLAGHTAGVQHTPSKKSSKKKDYTSSKALVELVEQTQLIFEPDTKYQYATLAYNLLAGVIEGASGKSYLAYMQENIFSPLNMHQTIPENISGLSSNDAQLYYFKKDKLVLDKQLVNGSYKLPGAGFRSTSIDLVKMMDAYTNGFIAPEVVKTMFTSNILKNGKKTNVGIGWRLNEDIHLKPTIEHAGSWQGARTVIVHYPEEQLSISIMINAKCVLFIEETAHIIAQLFLKDNNEVTELKGINQQLTVTHNRTHGNTTLLNGQMNFGNNRRGKLIIDTDMKFLQESNLYYLGFGNDYALSTDFGLLFFKLNLNPEIDGKLYLYQVLDDIHHINRSPMLHIKGKK